MAWVCDIVCANAVILWHLLKNCIGTAPHNGCTQWQVLSYIIIIMLCHATEQTHNFDNIIYDGCATKRMNAWWLVFGFDLDGWRRLSLFLSLFFFYIACECLFVFFLLLLLLFSSRPQQIWLSLVTLRFFLLLRILPSPLVSLSLFLSRIASNA